MGPNTIKQLRLEMLSLVNSQKAKASRWFFKTGKGEYGEGDQFIGLTVPQQRNIAKKYSTLRLQEVKQLLLSKIHEERLIAVFILVDQFQKGDVVKQKEIYEFYLQNRKGINNWDIVDSSASYIMGAYLADKSREILFDLARSDTMWDRRIAIIATHYFIRHKKEYRDTFKIAELLLHDKQDLIHKAVGWMLREVGKNISLSVEEEFLRLHYKTMSRTMLRYAIEHFTEEKRIYYLGKNKL